MDDDTRARFEELDKRLTAVDKRIDDLKWGAGLVAGLVGLIIGIGAVNFTAEKTSLREFQKDMKTELGHLEAQPDVELLGLNRASLKNQTVVGKIVVPPAKESGRKDGQDDRSNAQLLLDFHIRNKGDGRSGSMYVKLYTGEGIPLGRLSADEPTYKYEDAVNPNQLDPSEIPGKFASHWNMTFEIANRVVPKKGDYPALIKIFYGRGKVSEAPITLRIE